MQAIVLAGGLGTRLRSVVADVPKPMAQISGLPFLEYVFHHAVEQGVTQLVVACGYKHEVIQHHFGNRYHGVPVRYSVEESPLGTGGGLYQAVQQADADEVLVLNGDTLFDLPLNEFFNRSLATDGVLCLALKPMRHISRYGVVDTDAQGRITGFLEKAYYDAGCINGGVYVLRRSLFEGLSLPDVFSFERDIMEAFYQTKRFYGFLYDDYFIDIGIPEDFERARKELPDRLQPRRPSLLVDSGWTLFLDRDGVINKKKDNDYVRSVDEFEWLPEAPEALVRLSQRFGRLIVVTNQQGVGKGLMDMEDVHAIHQYLKEEIARRGGRLDEIYVAPELASPQAVLRKPATGMAELARKDFPEIDFNRSVMIGDSVSDLEFGKKLNMVTVAIQPADKPRHPLADFTAGSLAEAVWLFGRRH
ncbi:MAG: HAD-IIIA family hydrolase [Chitinophagales bacterium]|nr:HAD-IIIA family hydrolase [Chitinophagales bacterium]MDW8392759.1 HAD-IIIA family hydrolase [Chitinophagales bacterium]